MTPRESTLAECTIRRATLADLDSVSTIMLDAALWMQSRGIGQWNWMFTPRGREVVLQRIESTEAYLVIDAASRPIATFAIQWEDAQIWGERGRDGQAGYVHGLAVCRSVAGRGLGCELIEYATSIIHQRGRRLVRLDCMRDNAGLCDYYRRTGFTEVGVGGDGAVAARLFERSAK